MCYVYVYVLRLRSVLLKEPIQINGRCFPAAPSDLTRDATHSASAVTQPAA